MFVRTTLALVAFASFSSVAVAGLPGFAQPIKEGGGDLPPACAP